MHAGTTRFAQATVALLGIVAGGCASVPPADDSASGEPSPPGTAGGGAVVLPDVASGRTLVRDRASGVALAFSLDGAGEARAVRDGHAVRFPAGAPGGGDWVHLPGDQGTEDFVHFASRPAREEVSYRIDVASAAGLRLVAGVLELLDASGAPRVRMQAPYVIERSGRVTAARVKVEGCAVDTSPRPPWNRPTVAPGSPECVVRIAWSGVGAPVEYPAVLDPTWTTATSAMTIARRSHTATLLADGRVLIVGGERVGPSSTLIYHATAELFDPSTNTFAATGDLAAERSHHAAAALPDGSVLVAGGGNAGPVLGAAERWSPTTGQFTAAGTLRDARRDAALAVRRTGDAVISGGTDLSGATTRSTEFFDPDTGRWAGAQQMSSARSEHALVLLSLGQLLAIGGISAAGVQDLTSCEEFGSAGTWARTGSLVEARHGFGTAVLSPAQVLIAGGQPASGAAASATAELYDQTARAWTRVGTLSQSRAYPSLTATGSGAAVAAGGAVLSAAGVATEVRQSVEIFQPETQDWAALPALEDARYLHTGTLLGDGRILVVGGQGPTETLATAELLEFDGDGEPCASRATCQSGFCADGMCCASACEGTCEACAGAATGGADGTCSSVKVGADPRGDCADDGAPGCGLNGLCDGAGACDRYAASSCTPNPCTDDADCSSSHCADGVCCDAACDGDCVACTAGKKGSGGDGTCGPIESGEDPEAECPTVGAGICEGDGVCDGAGACRVPTAGTDCRAAACEDAVELGQAAVCGADGSCIPTLVSCSPFLCDAAAAACTTSCGDDGDCDPPARCTAGVCEKLPNGAACVASDDCTSGNCVDGVCCDTACNGQCAACNEAGNLGTCMAVEGAPRGSRAPCAADASGTCAGTCNGTVPDGCRYPGTETSCGPAAACEAGAEVADVCNGAGACARTPRTQCSPYACDVAACRTACTEDAHCAAGYLCEPDGTCVLENAPRCSDDEVRNPDGTGESCAPFTCRVGACTTTCESSDDCASGASCNEESGACEKKSAGDDGGCGCRISQVREQAAPAFGLTLLAALALLVRRKNNPKEGRR